MAAYHAWHRAMHDRFDNKLCHSPVYMYANAWLHSTARNLGLGRHRSTVWVDEDTKMHG